MTYGCLPKTEAERQALKDERRAQVAVSLTQLMREARIDIERGKAAMLADARWHAMTPVPEEHWMDCPYPGAVIAALVAYEASA